jgi:membrane-associated phospholipid phosphatase
VHRATATAVTISYLLVTAALAAIFRETLDSWAVIVVAHVAGCLALAWLARLESPPALLRAVRDWHPIILFPLLYKEVELMAAAFGNWRLTQVVPSLEAALFGGQPSLYLSEQWGSVALSEYLHFCYLAYVFVIPGVAGYWYATRRRVAFAELVLLLAVTMFGSYLFFILFPVDSPYYRSARLGPPFAGNFFFDLVHEMSARGGARGGAFPSAHVSGAVVTWLVAWRHQRWLAVVLAPVVGGLIVATVYGRFHYALDTLAGLLVAVVVVAVSTYGLSRRD